jgi:hypothetical protein
MYSIQCSQIGEVDCYGDGFYTAVKKGKKYRGPITKFLIKTEEENTKDKKDWY